MNKRLEILKRVARMKESIKLPPDTIASPKQVLSEVKSERITFKTEDGRLYLQD